MIFLVVAAVRLAQNAVEAARRRLTAIGRRGIIALFPVVFTSMMLILHPRIGGPATAAALANSGWADRARPCPGDLRRLEPRPRVARAPQAGAGPTASLTVTDGGKTR